MSEQRGDADRPGKEYVPTQVVFQCTEQQWQQALMTLGCVFQDEQWPTGNRRLRQRTLVQRLQAQGISTSMALALIYDLLGQSGDRHQKGKQNRHAKGKHPCRG